MNLRLTAPVFEQLIANLVARLSLFPALHRDAHDICTSIGALLDLKWKGA
jgi:hypothetical protein